MVSEIPKEIELTCFKLAKAWRNDAKLEIREVRMTWIEEGAEPKVFPLAITFWAVAPDETKLPLGDWNGRSFTPHQAQSQ